MKVKELIEKLNKFNQDEEVFTMKRISASDYEIEKVVCVKLDPQKENNYIFLELLEDMSVYKLPISIREKSS